MLKSDADDSIVKNLALQSHFCIYACSPLPRLSYISTYVTLEALLLLPCCNQKDLIDLLPFLIAGWISKSVSFNLGPFHLPPLVAPLRETALEYFIAIVIVTLQHRPDYHKSSGQVSHFCRYRVAPLRPVSLFRPRRS